MNETMDRRGAAIAAIVFAVLAGLGVAMVMGDSPDFVDDTETISTYFADNDGKILGGGMIVMLTGFALLWLVGGLRQVFDRAAGDAHRAVVGTAAAGGVVAASAYLFAGAVLAVGGARVDEHGPGGAASALFNWDLFTIFYGAVVPMAFAALLVGVAILSLRARVVFPAWFGGLSALLALVGLIPPISWTLAGGVAVWALIAGLLLLRSTPATTA